MSLEGKARAAIAEMDLKEPGRVIQVLRISYFYLKDKFQLPYKVYPALEKF